MVSGKPKLIAILTAAVLLLVAPCSSQTSKPSPSANKPDAKVASFAGCYELKMGRWWPWGFG
jgi:hypothetical protein